MGPYVIEILGFIELIISTKNEGWQFKAYQSVTPLTLRAEEMEVGYVLLVGDGRNDMKDFYVPLIDLPTTILVYRDGNICNSHFGYGPKTKFEAEILSLL